MNSENDLAPKFDLFSLFFNHLYMSMEMGSEILISGIGRARLGAYPNKNRRPQSFWFLKEIR
jgi:hypothetical protein